MRPERTRFAAEQARASGWRHAPAVRMALPSAVLVALLAAVALAQQTPPGAETSGTELEVEVESLSRLDKREFDLRRALESARLDLASGERRFAAAEDRLDAEPDPSAALREEVAARRLQLSNAQRAVALLEQQIERVARGKQSSQRLRELAGRRVEAATLASWLEEAESAVEELTREQSLKRNRAEELSQELAFARQQQEPLPAGSPLERWAGLRTQSIEALVDLYAADIAALENALQLEQQLAATLQRETAELPLYERLRAILQRFVDVWNYPLTGPETEPITPGKITAALAIFLIGYYVARAASAAIGRRVLPRIRLEEGAAQAFQSLTFYLLLLVAFLTALRMVQIPLTAFAVLGGALAIGVGFGSQNVVNNFISGLILLAERPIKIGDLIEVQGVYGTVERIGLRSTRVRTGDNIHIIVPNASFLESNVVNWTHTDPRVRITISVGIVYGSPTREAERLIRQALAEEPRVLSQPDPVVLFRDFGDNALVFEVRFWIEMRTMLDRLRVESDLRFRIDDLYREAGIVIAFPQRDVHLDTTAPIEVRMLGSEAQDSAREAGGEAQRS